MLKKIFKFTASIKLAVPLMLIFLFACIYGTILESNYNAEYASIVVYKSWWFVSLLFLIWINIFNATVSRIPFKKRHTGFLITHTGLLLLFAGGMLTALYGIDGTIKIYENEAQDTVTHNNYVLELKNINKNESFKLSFKRAINELNTSTINKLNDWLREHGIENIKIKKYYPFTYLDEVFVEDKTQSKNQSAVKLKLKNQFLDTSIWIHESEKDEVDLGPLFIKWAHNNEMKTFKKTDNQKKFFGVLEVESIKNPTQKTQINLENFNSTNKTTINFYGKNLKLNLNKIYYYASVEQNRLIDKTDKNKELGPNNPAIEFFVSFDDGALKNQSFREIAFARFTEFNFNTYKKTGLKFRYILTQDDLKRMQNFVQEKIKSSDFNFSKNTVLIKRIGLNQINLTLIKNNEIVIEKKLSQGEVLETPWMGLKITLEKLLDNAKSSYEVVPITITQKQGLPPSAFILENSLDPNESLNLSENENVFLFDKNGDRVELYYGRERLILPFYLSLEKFTQINYPNSQMAMEYQSLVKLSDDPEHSYTIKMNDPLKKNGFTFYQASFIEDFNGNKATVLSVNMDPGRMMKYFGSFITCIGIVVFTLMRSRWYQNKVLLNQNSKKEEGKAYA